VIRRPRRHVILAENYTPTCPLGKNTAFANDDPTECNPTSLC
jgi:hypothetical protein